MKNEIKTILFVAGHSGGHIIPCATQAKKEKENNNYKIYFITTTNSLDKKIINGFNYIDEVFYLPILNISKNPIKLIKFIWKLNISFIKSIFLLKKLKPSKVVSMGGIISIPVCLAAKFFNIKVELWELNVEPGKTIIFLSKFFNKINICFEDTKKYFPSKNCTLVSYPLRFNLSCKQICKESIIKKVNFSLDKKTVLIVGGSQGSQFINNLFKEFILKNLNIADKIQIIHQTGISNFDWNHFYNSNNVQAITFNFHDKINEHYKISDLVICRAGAGTLAEVEFFEKKCIIIPLQTNTTSHQVLNASSISKKNPALFKIFKQTDDFKIFEYQIKKILLNN